MELTLLGLPSLSFSETGGNSSSAGKLCPTLAGKMTMVSSGLPFYSFMTRQEIVPSTTWLGKGPEEVFSLAHLESCTQFWTNCRGQRGALLWFSWTESLAQPCGNEVQDRHIQYENLLAVHLGSHDAELLAAPQEQFPLFFNRTKGASWMHGC